jgi:hypothetical protein
MAVPFLTIADALALRFAPGNVTPPTGYRNIARSTARLENNLVNAPFVAVYPPEPGSVEVTISPGKRRTVIPFRIRFFFDRSSGDLPKNVKALYEWAEVLFDLLRTESKLGLGGGDGVAKAIPTTGPGFAPMEYAGTEYDAIEWIVSVWYEDAYQMTP